MVTRRFKKGSVYDALASTSGLDFSPVVQAKSLNKRENAAFIKDGKGSDKFWRETADAKLCNEESNFAIYEENLKQDHGEVSFKRDLNPQNASVDNKLFSPETYSSKHFSSETYQASHEKYPSWPVTSTGALPVSNRSHSWNSNADYRKAVASHPSSRKSNQSNFPVKQLQPNFDQITDNFAGSFVSPETSHSLTAQCSSPFLDNFPLDLDNSHTMPMPHSEARIRTGSQYHSEQNLSATSASVADELYHVSQKFENFPSEIPSYKEHKNLQNESFHSLYSDKLGAENPWQVAPPPIQIISTSTSQLKPFQYQGNDSEYSSDNNAWTGIMDNCYRPQSAQWQGSHSDLSTLSTQLSNRSSLFDSGHSTMPESDGLSPQSSCDGTISSLTFEGPTRAQVIARHGIPQETVAHSARVQQPKRHGSESVLYYATYSSNYMSNEHKQSSRGAESANVSFEGVVPSSPEFLTKSKSDDFLDFPHNAIQKSVRQSFRRTPDLYRSWDCNSSAKGFCQDAASESLSSVHNVKLIPSYDSLNKLNYRNDLPSPQKTYEFENSFHNLKNDSEHSKLKLPDGLARKCSFSDFEKRQRASDPELKAIQKQAVMSFYQRMSIAESVKSEQLCTKPSEIERPLEASQSCLSLFPGNAPLRIKKPNKQPDARCQKPIFVESHLSLSKQEDCAHLNLHSKSVPNLVMLKENSSRSGLKRHDSNALIGAIQSGPQEHLKKAFPLMKDETISWDELPNILRKEKEALANTTPTAESKGGKSPQESGDQGIYARGMQYFKPRKEQLKEIHPAKKKNSFPGIFSIPKLPEQQQKKVAPNPPHKRRPAPPPPPQQISRKPPPPPPPVTPPPVEAVENCGENESIKKQEELRSDVKLPVSSLQLCWVSPSSEETFSSEGNVKSKEPQISLPSQTQRNANHPVYDESLMPDPQLSRVPGQNRMLDSSTIIYPKDSYMSYISEKKQKRQGFDCKYKQPPTSLSEDNPPAALNFQKDPCSRMQDQKIEKVDSGHSSHSDCLQIENLCQKTTPDDSISEDKSHMEVFQHISSSRPEESDLSQISVDVSSQNSVSQADFSLTKQNFHSSQELEISSSETLFSDSQNVSTVLIESPSSAFSPSLLNNNSKSVDQTVIDSSFVESESSSLKLDLNSNLDETTSDVGHELIVDHNDNQEHKNSESGQGFRSCFDSNDNMEYDQLSREYIRHSGDSALKNLLIPSPSYKTMADYMDGLLNMELGTDEHSYAKWLFKSETLKSTNFSGMNYEDIKLHYEKNENKAFDEEVDLKTRKDELLQSIENKISILRQEQLLIKEEMVQNEFLGQDLLILLKKHATNGEIEKYSLHVMEMDKIIGLLLSLSGRLARAENTLKTISDSGDEKKICEVKIEKLKEQYEDAKRLKESIDRRSSQVSAFLHRYFTDEEYENYDRYIKLKTKFIVEIREIDEKISLGEEQLAALSVIAHL